MLFFAQKINYRQKVNEIYDIITLLITLMSFFKVKCIINIVDHEILQN